MKLTERFIKPFTSLKFWKDLYNEIDQDQVFNGAAALSFYFLLAIVPAMIFLLTLLPYLPIENLSGEVMNLISQALPESAAKALEGPVLEITASKKQGLLSFGILFTLWSASSGLYAIMQELNTTYDVRETRSFLKVRGLSVLLTLAVGVGIIIAFALIVSGGVVQKYLDATYVLNPVVPVLFAAFRWIVILVLLLASFALLYYYGTNVEQKFKFVTPGAIVGVLGLVLVSLGFRLYVSHFSDYTSSYGSLGAIVVLMMWFYLAGTAVLVGSEINALIENSPTKKTSVAQNAAFKEKAPPENPTPGERAAATPAGHGTPAGAHA